MPPHVNNLWKLFSTDVRLRHEHSARTAAFAECWTIRHSFSKAYKYLCPILEQFVLLSHDGS